MNPIEHNYEFNNKDMVYPQLTRLTQLQRQVGKTLPVMVHGSGDSGNHTALQLAQVADDFPELTFLMVHAGFIWCCGTTGETAPRHPNLLPDLTGNPVPHSVIEAYRKCGAAKFTIGTDGPPGIPAIKEKIGRSIPASSSLPQTEHHLRPLRRKRLPGAFMPHRALRERLSGYRLAAALRRAGLPHGRDPRLD